jgi:hypothetical protein
LCEALRWRSDEAAQLLGTSAAAVASSLQRARVTLARQSHPHDPGNVDADQLAQYLDAFRRYDTAMLVGMIRVEADPAARPAGNKRLCGTLGAHCPGRGH